LHKTAEFVEKAQTANFNDFGIVKNQQLARRQIEQKRQILGFSTASLFYRKVAASKSCYMGTMHAIIQGFFAVWGLAREL